MKATRPRLLVLGLLQELGGHHSVDELVEALTERGTPLPRASVYNAINKCVSHGLVMLADAGPGPALYEASGTWHHHFVCTACGIIIDIPCLKGDKPCLLPDRVPGLVEEAQIIFRGICNECLSKNTTNTPENVSIGADDKKIKHDEFSLMQAYFESIVRFIIDELISYVKLLTSGSAYQNVC